MNPTSHASHPQPIPIIKNRADITLTQSASFPTDASQLPKQPALIDSGAEVSLTTNSNLLHNFTPFARPMVSLSLLIVLVI